VDILAEKAMPEHQVTGEITVQCIEGSVEFTAAETNQLMLCWGFNMFGRRQGTRTKSNGRLLCSSRHSVAGA